MQKSKLAGYVKGIQFVNITYTKAVSERSLPVCITLLSTPFPSSLSPWERKEKSVIGRRWNNVPNLTVTAYEADFH